MSNEINFGSPSNFILAEGKRENPFGLWWLIAVGIVTVIITAMIAFIVLLYQPVQIPSEATLYVTAPPKALSELPDALNETLPAEIREIVDTNSHWPITVGLYRAEEQWQWFMVGPRWMIKNKTSANGLVALFKSDVKNEEAGRTFHYTTSLATILPFKDTFSMELEPQLLADASGLDILLDEEPITGTFKNGILQLDIDFESQVENLPLKNADIAITVPRNGITEDALKDFIRRLSNGRHHHLKTPELSQYHVWIDKNGYPTLTTYSFEEPLSDTDAAQLLGAYGFFSKKTILLPDGTLSYEHVAPTASSTTSLFGEHINEQNEIITLKEAELIVQSSNHTPAASEDIPFCDHNPWMRTSGNSLKFILDSIGAKDIPDTLPDIQIGSQENKLSICFE